MMELANKIDRNATAWVSQYGIPRVNRIFGVGDSADDDKSATPIIQGSTPVVFRTVWTAVGVNSVTRALAAIDFPGVRLLSHAMPPLPATRADTMPAQITTDGSSIPQ